MCSKSSATQQMLSRGLLLVLGVLVLASCTPKVGEEPPKTEVYEFQGTACLSETSDTVREFIFGRASDGAVSAGWDCVGSAFDSFQRYVRGQSRDVYTPAELATFFEDNFFTPSDKGSISVGLQTELMKFKQMFVGGNREVVTRAEIQKTISLIADFKRISLRLNPHMQIFLRQWIPEFRLTAPDRDLPRFETANQEMQLAARELGILIQSNNSSYELDDFTAFFTELSAFYGENWSWIASVRKYMPVVKKIKKAFTGGNENSILPSEWPTMLLLSGRGYIQFLRYSYFVEPEEVTDRGLKLAFVARTIEDAFSVFEDLVKHKETGEVTRGEMNEIFEALSQAWPEFRTSDKLSLEFMKMKQVFFGGTVDAWAVTDFETARLKVGHLKILIERVMPFTAIYGIEWDVEGMPVDQVEKTLGQATEALRSSLVELGGELKAGYDTNDLLEFVREWKRLYPDEKPDTAALGFSFEDHVPVLQRVKNVIYEQNDTIIRQQQWPSLLGYASRAFGTYLEYHYLLKGRDQRDPAVMTGWQNLISRATGLAQDVVAGKGSGSLTTAELEELMSAVRVVVPEIPISRKLSEEYMALKALLFGGAGDRLAVADFEGVRAKLPDLRKIYDLLSPYAEVYSLDWKPSNAGSSADRIFSEAADALKEAAKLFGTLAQGNYDLNRLGVVVDELRRVAAERPKQDDPVKKYLPVIIRVKNLIYAQKDGVVRGNQWPGLMSFAGRGYAAFLEYNYFLGNEKNGFRKLHVVERWRSWSAPSLQLVRDMVATKVDGPVTRTELMTLLRDLQKAGLISNEINLAGFDDVVQVALNRILVPVVDRLMGRGTNTLNVKTVDLIQKELSAYLRVQAFILQNIRTDQVLTGSTIRDRIAKHLSRNSGMDEVSKDAFKDLSDILRSPVPLVMDGKSRWIITARARPGYNLDSLETHNILRLLSQYMVSSYASERSRIDSGAGVTLNEAERAFKEFRNFGIRQGMLEPDNLKFMSNRFREANIFMPRADGNQLASRMEIHELMFSIMSGIALDKMLQADLRRTCTSASGHYRSKSKMVSYNCLLSVYKRSIPRHMTATPELLRYQKGVPVAVFDQFFYNSLKGAGWVPREDGFVKLEDIGLFPHLLQYVELVYARFDADADMGIRVPEARVAFPAFRSLFRELARAEIESGRITENDLLGLFTYILRYGKPPGGLWEGLTQWLPWRDNPGTWEHYADRSKMAEILGFISDQINKPKAVVPPTPGQGSNR